MKYYRISFINVVQYLSGEEDIYAMNHPYNKTITACFIKINAEYPFLCRKEMNAKKLDKRTYVLVKWIHVVNNLSFQSSKKGGSTACI